MSEVLPSSRHRIAVSLTPELYEKTMQVAGMMGLSDSAAARYLMMRGLESFIALLASTSSTEVLKNMFSIFEREVDQAHDVGSPVAVTPDCSVRNGTRRSEGKRQ